MVIKKNLRGGKAYKKSKKAGDEDNGKRFIAKTKEQEYARVTKLLGNRRVLCFCNDGLDRVCKIRGGICRGSSHKQLIEVGDIVLISTRSYLADSDDEKKPALQIAVEATGTDTTETAATLASGRKDVADIITKYDRSNWRDIRKEQGIHPFMFPTLHKDVEEEDIFEDEESEKEIDVDDI